MNPTDRSDLRPASGPGVVHRLVGLVGLALVALLLAATAVTGPAAQPASAADPTDVFIGVVDQTTASAAGPAGSGGSGAGTGAGAGSGGAASAGRTVTYDVTVLSVYLGDIRTEEVQVISTPAFFSCPTRRVVLGQQYAFRVAGSGDALVASTCGDVRLATASVRRALARDFPDVRPPVAPGATFDEVSYSSTDLSDPTEFTRAAAPGAALVIVGLLGLLVARRFVRSRG